MVALVLLAAITQGIVLCAISVSYRLAKEAQLNIGLLQVIWSLNPFLQSVVDCKCLKLHRVIGALLIAACAGLTAYSTNILNLEMPDPKIAVLASFSVPLAQLVGSLISRQALTIKGADP